MQLVKIIYRLRTIVAQKTTERVKLVAEIIPSVKLIKMYAWEKPFTDKLNGKSKILTFVQKFPIYFLHFMNFYWDLDDLEVRKKESKSLKNLLIAQSLMLSISQMVPIFATALTLLAMTIFKADFSLLQV